MEESASHHLFTMSCFAQLRAEASENDARDASEKPRNENFWLWGVPVSKTFSLRANSLPFDFDIWYHPYEACNLWKIVAEYLGKIIIQMLFNFPFKISRSLEMLEPGLLPFGPPWTKGWRRVLRATCLQRVALHSCAPKLLKMMPEMPQKSRKKKEFLTFERPSWKTFSLS